ncbi:hypothetical protein XBKQ1_1430019 [Xenorhabdus bovienii str. kraussei Quebec]|uniref:Uncharacterized protein n=1 Tax=Xenorhabdus bovienii str. kraussei Quebec TaxID=1398203 RepID=A0A077PCE9_XENBV|nr:hypothetical protein XBKQ1_1430019 [Xenorhabdus bovienii str. kraussei Quebec]
MVEFVLSRQLDDLKPTLRVTAIVLIAIAFSYLSAFGYFKLVLSSNTTK